MVFKINKSKEVSTIMKKICSSCGEPRRLGEFYYSSSYSNKATKSVTMCKKCISQYVTPEYKNLYDMKVVKSVLRMIDKPFVQRIWDASIEEVSNKKDNHEYFGTYMKNIAMKDFKDLTWDNSEFETVEKVKESKYKDDLVFSAEEVKNFKKFWGEYSPDDYLFLEDFYRDYINNFPTDTPAQINIYKNLAKIHLNAEKELNANNIKNYKDLMDLSSKMHSDGNIKPIQSNGVGDDKGISAYGLWIKDIEREEPAEFFDKKPLYDDFDGFKKYIEKWLLRPMKNIFGVSKDFDVGEGK